MAKATDPATQTFIEQLKKLCDEADQAVRKVAYLKALIGNTNVPEKIGSSHSGFALAVANRTVLESVILFCVRMWDKDKDAISLRNAAKLVPSSANIIDYQIAKNNLLPRDLAQAQFDQRILDWRCLFDLVEQHSQQESLRFFRNEWLAHRVDQCRDRKKQGTDKLVDEATRNGVVDLATKTLNLIGDLGRTIDRQSNPYPDRLKSNEAYCQEFWRILPVLKDAEVI